MRSRIIFLVSVLLVVGGLSAAVQADPWRFIVTGDSRSGSGDINNGVNIPILSEIATAIVSEDPEFLLFGGDLIYGASDAATHESQLITWRDTMAPVYGAGIKVYPVRGNHDDNFKSAWDNVFAGIYALPANGPAGEENVTFSFTHENVFVAGLDQYGSHPRRVNQTWLDQQFAANNLEHVFVLGHEPAFQAVHSDCLDDYPTERDAFWDSIGAEGGLTYFCGHDHLIDHAKAQDSAGTWLHQFILGTAGAPWVLLYEGQHSDPSVVDVYYSIWNYVYMIVDIDGLDVTMTTMERSYDGTPGVFSATDVFSYSVYSRSDLDLDDDVDGYDFLTFSLCFNNSLNPPQSGCSTVKADTDGDGDVDGNDFITFSLCFNGSDNPPNIP